MLWTFIVLSIIGFFIYNHFKQINDSKERLRKQIEEEGGMATKYCTLIDTLLFVEEARISELTRDSVKLIANYSYEINTFLIVPLGYDVRITCETNGAMGESTKIWEFSRNVDQEAMGIRILREMNSKRANAISERKLIDYEKRNPQVAQQMMVEFEAIPKGPLREPIYGFDDEDLREELVIPKVTEKKQEEKIVSIMCDECDDRGYVYCCDNCGGSISFVERNEDFYEYCGNCSKGSHVDIVTRPCACRNQF